MAKQLRILEVCNQDRFLASPYMLPLLEALLRKGHVVEAACRVTDGAGVLEERGVTVHDLPFTRSLTPLQDARVYGKLKDLIGEGRYDIVHTHTPKDGILGRRAAWKAKVPAVVHTCNGFYFSETSSRARRRLVLRAERYAARRCHHLVFVSGEDMALAVKLGIAKPGRLSYIPDGVDEGRFRPGEEPGLREELGIPPGARVVGYVGEMTQEKDQGTLLEALRLLGGGHGDLHAVLVGDSVKQPEAMRELKKRAEEMGLGERVAFPGYRRDVERFYRIFDVYAHPSLREGFGVPLIEAMATGVPVVACRVRGPREIIRDGINGTLVEPGDATELSAAVAFYLEEPEAVRNHTARAREEVLKSYRLKKMHNSLIALYARLTRAAEAGSGPEG
jgi:glycosyltransferase involved in cell wall biosynthesis